MKWYVSVDMEGIAGVVLREQLIRGELLYEEARRLLTQEVNVVVETLSELGADDIVVKDAHGRGFNFCMDVLSPHARYVLGATRMDRRFPGLDESFDGALLIGYHAKMGTLHAVRDHTMTATDWQDIMLNGQSIGEIQMDSLLFGICGVPVIFVSGDDKTCEESHRDLPWATTYETKQGTGRHAAITKPPRRVYAELPEAITKAVANRHLCRPSSLSAPYELQIRFTSTDLADARDYDGVTSRRVDGLTAVYVDDDLVRLFARAM